MPEYICCNCNSKLVIKEDKNDRKRKRIYLQQDLIDMYIEMNLPLNFLQLPFQSKINNHPERKMFPAMYCAQNSIPTQPSTPSTSSAISPLMSH